LSWELQPKRKKKGGRAHPPPKPSSSSQLAWSEYRNFFGVTYIGRVQSKGHELMLATPHFVKERTYEPPIRAASGPVGDAVVNLKREDTNNRRKRWQPMVVGLPRCPLTEQ